jgi:hypothetical protein
MLYRACERKGREEDQNRGREVRPVRARTPQPHRSELRRLLRIPAESLLLERVSISDILLSCFRSDLTPKQEDQKHA